MQTFLKFGKLITFRHQDIVSNSKEVKKVEETLDLNMNYFLSD